MKVYNDLDFIIEESAVCIGKFDGIHKGHRSLIEECKKTGLPVVMLCITFSNKVSIYSDEEQEKLAKELGIDYLVRLKMTDELLHLSPRTFIEKILVYHLAAKMVAIGEDFGFGYQRKGDAKFLRYAGSKLGFNVCVKEKIKYGEEDISSTRIKKALENGSVNLVNELLGEQYHMTGEVVSGNHIGGKSLVPTLNIYPAKRKEVPKNGVYATRVLIDGKMYNGIGNFGVKPTIENADGTQNKRGLEVSVFDFDGDLYGKKVIVYFVGFIRDEKKFDSLEELGTQIKRDIKIAKNILA